MWTYIRIICALNIRLVSYILLSVSSDVRSTHVHILFDIRSISLSKTILWNLKYIWIGYVICWHRYHACHEPWIIIKKKITCHLFNHFFYFFFAILRSPKEFYIIFFSLEFNLNLLSLFSSFEHGDSLFLKHSWNVVLVHPNNFLFSLELALIFWNFNIPLQIWSYWVMV